MYNSQQVELWKDWNYNVGHDDFICDKYNPDMITFMSNIMKPAEHDIIMIYNPESKDVEIVDECYFVKSNTYIIGPFNNIYIQSSHS